MKDYDDPRKEGCDKGTLAEGPSLPVPKELAGIDGATLTLRISRVERCRGAVWALVTLPETTPCDDAFKRHCFTAQVERRSDDNNSDVTRTDPREQADGSHNVHSYLLNSKDRELRACVAPVGHAGPPFCTPWTATDSDGRFPDSPTKP